MRTIHLKTLAISLAFGLFAVLGNAEYATAQGKSQGKEQKQESKAIKEQHKADKAQAKADQQKVLWDQQRQNRWDDRNKQIITTRSGNDRSGGAGYYYGNANANTNRDAKYRVYRNGSYYDTNQQGADLLRQAVNQGYQQGFQAGRSVRNSNRDVSWDNSQVYRSGSYGYQNYVSQSQYRYYFQQGFQRGYQDGSNSRYQTDYNGQYDYGYYDNGSMNILESILNSVLRIQTN